MGTADDVGEGEAHIGEREAGFHIAGAERPHALEGADEIGTGGTRLQGGIEIEHGLEAFAIQAIAEAGGEDRRAALGRERGGRTLAQPVAERVAGVPLDA